MRNRIFFLLFFISYSFLLSGQEYLTSIRHYNLEKGLETRDIRFAMKDSQGFLWFTSELGAYRFDGYEFKNYRRKVNTNDLFSIYHLGEDSQGNIWFNHIIGGQLHGHVSILPLGQDSLVSIDDLTPPLSTQNLVKAIFRPPHFVALVYDEGQIFEYANGSFSQIFQLPIDDNSTIFERTIKGVEIEKTPDDLYWIIYDKDLLIVSSDQKLVKQEPLSHEYSHIHKDHKDRIWIHRGQNIYLKETINSPLQPAPFEKDMKNSVDLYDHGFHLGYYLFAKKSDTYNLSLVNLDDFSIIDIEPFGIEKTNISPYGYFIENPYSIWLNTHDGIYHIQLTKKVFQNYLQGTSNRKMIRGEDNDLWATSSRGFYKIDREKKKEEVISKEWRFGKDLLWESPDKIWMAYHHNGVAKINLTHNIIEKEYILADKGFIKFIHRDKKTNQIWLGTSIGLYKYDKSKDDFLLFHHQDDFSKFDSISVLHFGEFEDINLISTDKGIFEFDRVNGFTKHFPVKDGTFSYDYITHIHQDKEDQTYWLGTKLAGLIHWNKRNNTSKFFTTQNGLSDNLIYAVYEDDDKFLWLPSNKGLMRFNKKTEEVITFTTQDGLPYDEFNYSSHFQDEEGNLYFGGLNGITTFHPKDLPKTTENAPLRIIDFEILDTKKGEMISRWDDFKQSNKIELSPSEKNFRLTVSLLDYQKPSANEYQYKVEGFNNEWKTVEGNKINIHELPSGNFNILIKAQNPKDFWSNQTLNIPVHIQKPFYLNWWFILSVILLLFALVNLFIRIRTANLISKTEKLEKEVARRTEKIEKDKAVIEKDKITIEKQANELQKLDELKTRFFANVTHELRTPLTLITSPLKRLMTTQKLDPKTRQTIQNIAQNGEHLKDLVEEILDLSRLEGGKLNIEKKPVHFQQKIKEWFQSFDAIAHNREMNYQMNYQLPLKTHLNIDVKKTQKIVFNLLSNAFKFSKSNDTITLDISENKNNAIIKVSDTGEGIHEDDLPYIFDRFYQSKQINQNLNGGLGIGLAMSKELAQLMNGKLYVESTLGKGTTFTFEFPKETIVRKSSIPQNSPIQDTSSYNSSNAIQNFKHTILIVEDHLQMQAFVQELIASFANTVIANNGKEALKILDKENQNINLIISDVMMPEMDGFTFLEIIKNKPQWQLIPIVMLTARADISDKLNALTIGVDDYLIKPFEPEELITRVKNLLERIDLREKLAEESIPVSSYKKKDPILDALDSVDIKWLKKLEKLAFEKVTTPNFNISQLAHEMTIGERQLNRKVKKITGLTPGNYLKEIKLQKARQLLENKAYSTVAEISYLVGFTTPQYFSKLFKERFGKLPSDYFKY